jgi:triosephosphate isomerase
MRKPILAGNWKMHKTPRETAELIRGLGSALADFDYTTADVVICPPFVDLAAARDAIGDTPIGLGAQNMHWEREGAFTGEISPVMLRAFCDYVILGHSERRHYFGETDEDVNRKLHTAFEHGLTPILCVGENKQQNEAGETVPFVGNQVRAALEGVGRERVVNLIVAYEPIWAIGTGVAATGEDANAIIGAAIRDVLASLYDNGTAQQVRVQYGGSTKPDNIVEFVSQPEIDGALVGGASLKADSFAALVRRGAQAQG